MTNFNKFVLSCFPSWCVYRHTYFEEKKCLFCNQTFLFCADERKGSLPKNLGVGIIRFRCSTEDGFHLIQKEFRTHFKIFAKVRNNRNRKDLGYFNSCF